MNRPICAFSICTFLCVSPIISAAIPPGYTIAGLSPLTAGQDTFASDINEAGLVLGWSGSSFGATTVTWTDGVPTAHISNQAGGQAINEGGHIAGDLNQGGGGSHAFFWNGASVQDIHSLGIKSVGIEISDSDEVVGWFETSPGRPMAYRWKAGVMTSLGTFGGPESTAHGINDSGQVVGSAETSNLNDRAYIWSDANGDNVSDPGEMVQLPDMGLSSSANGVNDAGVAAGFVLNGQFKRVGAIWKDNTSFQPIGLLPNRTESEAFDINNQGQVVGISGVPFVWEDGQIVELSTLVRQGQGWTLLSAEAINDTGWIIGSGLRLGKQTGYLLIPIPEPSGSILIISSVGLLLSRRPPRFGRVGTWV
jgi:probable HAF family extracellular repeat protein